MDEVAESAGEVFGEGVKYDMPKHIDLTGQIIGNWKVLKVDHIDKHHNYKYECECQLCHKTKRIMYKQAIEKTNTYGCGCNKILDLTGFKTGHYTVLYKAEDVSDMAFPRKAWMCQCDCGTVRRITETTLINNKNENYSCGCLRKKINDIIIHDDYIEIILNNSDNNCLIDTEDYELIKNNHWVLSSDGYAISSSGDLFRKRMHRIIMHVNNDLLIDHINRNRLDNRKSNLRIVDNQHNSFNQTIRSTNTSGVIGVTWWKRDQNWSAQIKYNYKSHRLGYFDNFDDAVIARLNAEIKYFGKEYAPQKHLFERYGIE